MGKTSYYQGTIQVLLSRTHDILLFDSRSLARLLILDLHQAMSIEPKSTEGRIPTLASVSNVPRSTVPVLMPRQYGLSR